MLILNDKQSVQKNKKEMAWIKGGSGKREETEGSEAFLKDYLGSGRTIFLLALAAGVHLLFSMAIK